jgi:hypothetical protein
MLAGDLDAKRAADDSVGAPRSEKLPLFATFLWLLTVGLLPGILLRESQHTDALASTAGLLNICDTCLGGKAAESDWRSR